MLFDGNKVSKIVKNVDRIFHVYLNLEGIMKYDNYNSKKIKRFCNIFFIVHSDAHAHNCLYYNPNKKEGGKKTFV